MSFRKILVLMDNRQDSNWGSQATTNALFGLLAERFPEAELRGVPREAARPSSAFLRRASERLGPKALLAGRYGAIVRMAMEAVTDRWAQDWNWADLVVVNGEGTLHPQNQATRWLTGIDYLRKQAPKPLWIVNCSIMCKGHPDEAMYKKVLGEADYLAVREEESHKELASMGVSSVLAADCAFLTEPEEDGVSEVMHDLQIASPFAIFTGTATVRDWPIESQGKVVQKLQSHGLQVVYASSTPQDTGNFERLGLHIPFFNHEQVNYRQLMSLQGRAQVLVGGRFHPTILAALMGTPFVCVTSNTHKMEALMNMLGTRHHLFSLNDEQNLLAAIDHAVQTTPEERTSLEQRARSYVERARLNVKAG